MSDGDPPSVPTITVATRCQPRSPLTGRHQPSLNYSLDCHSFPPSSLFSMQEPKVLFKIWSVLFYEPAKFHPASHPFIMKSSFILWCSGLCTMGPLPALHPTQAHVSFAQRTALPLAMSIWQLWPHLRASAPLFLLLSPTLCVADTPFSKFQCWYDLERLWSPV